MSGSPKYTNVAFEAARRAQLEEARRQREAQRRRLAEAERARRLRELTDATRHRAAAVAAQAEALLSRSTALPQHADVVREAGQISARRADIDAATEESAVKRLDRSLRDAERRIARLTGAVSKELTLRQHASAVDVLVAHLDRVAERDIHDPEGYRAVAALTAQARERIGDAARFPAAHHTLAEAATGHLDLVAERQAQMQRLTSESDVVAGQLTAVLTEAGEAGLKLPEVAEVNADLAALRSAARERHVTRWEHRIGVVKRRVEELTATVDAHLDQLERMAIIVEAATAALPAAGLRVVPESLTEHAGAVRFTAARPDGSVVELTVHAGDGRATRLEYHTDATDTVVEATPDGEVSRCDLTEELLERFHAELAEQGVRTDGLHWQGKPDRPQLPPHIKAVPIDRSRS